MMARVQFEAELGDEIELSFEKIDVVLLVHHQLLEQVACHIITRGVAPIDYSPILLLRPFGFRIAPDTLPSGLL